MFAADASAILAGCRQPGAVTGTSNEIWAVGNSQTSLVQTLNLRVPLIGVVPLDAPRNFRLILADFSARIVTVPVPSIAAAAVGLATTNFVGYSSLNL